MPPITIRPAQPQDSAQIAELTTQLGYPSNPSETARRLAAGPHKGRTHPYCILETNGLPELNVGR